MDSSTILEVIGYSGNTIIAPSAIANTAPAAIAYKEASASSGVFMRRTT